MGPLSRRSFLRGTSVAIALPWLEAMSPSPVLGRSQGDENLPPRLVCCYIPNGVNIAAWTPVDAGRNYSLSPSLAPLAPVKEYVSVLSGLGHGNSEGGHFGADEFLTGADLNGTPGRDYANSVSVDQVAARKHGLLTRIPSLELSSNSGSGAAGHSHTLAFDEQGTPLPAQNSPRAVFNRLFGADDAASRDKKLQRIAESRSILDSVADDARAMSRKLGGADRRKLDEYLQSVREVERRVTRHEAWLDAPKPKVSADGLHLDTSPLDARHRSRYFRTMFDVMLLALQTDATRVITFALEREAGGGQFDEIGVPDVQHSLSHHGGDPGMLERLARIDRFLVEQFAYFLGRLHTAIEGDANLLGRTMVLFGSGMNSGQRGDHSPRNLPLLLAGGERLGLKQGHHLRFDVGATPFCNVHLTLLQRMSVEQDAFMDSTGTLTGLT